MALFNRARMTTATTGTGSITLGSATAGFQSFAAAGVTDGDEVSYLIEDGTAWEIGTGTYTASGTLLSRSVGESSTGSAINLSGDAIVMATLRAEDVGGGGGEADYQEFLTSGTWTKPEGCSFVYIEAVGGGGSGSVRIRDGAIAPFGGSGGLFMSGMLLAEDLAASVAVTVGAGGASVSRTDDDASANGIAGGSSVFDSITARGGAGGSAIGVQGDDIYGNTYSGGLANSAAIKGAGAGGNGSISSGVVGHPSLSAGAGGNGEASSNANATGMPGETPGGGGGGAGANSSSSKTVTSGAGASGRVRVWAW